jgi:hypothetical protein
MLWAAYITAVLPFPEIIHRYLSGMMEQIGSWLVSGLILVVQLAFFYGIVRLFFLGRPVLNPFKKGWSSLQADFGIAAPPRGMESTSAMIGIVTYKNTAAIKLAEEGLYLGKTFFGESYVCIPYHAIRINTPPRRASILRISFVLDGIFTVNGVDISLKAQQAKDLIEIIVYAEMRQETGGKSPEN